MCCCCSSLASRSPRGRQEYYPRRVPACAASEQHCTIHAAASGWCAGLKLMPDLTVALLLRLKGRCAQPAVAATLVKPSSDTLHNSSRIQTLACAGLSVSVIQVTFPDCCAVIQELEGLQKLVRNECQVGRRYCQVACNVLRRCDLYALLSVSIGVRFLRQIGKPSC